MRAMRQAQMLLKLKRIKRQISKHTFGHSVRERERERLKNLEELREGRTAEAVVEKQRVNGRSPMTDLPLASTDL